jgi:hypothetical protein
VINNAAVKIAVVTDLAAPARQETNGKTRALSAPAVIKVGLSFILCFLTADSDLCGLKC